jgi:hypothetical protein
MLYYALYRVGLYGKCFSEEKEAGKEYVIKVDSTCLLGEMQTTLGTMYEKVYNKKNKVEIITDQTDLRLYENDDAVRLQIIPVIPYIDPQQLQKRVRTDFMKWTMLNVFYYEKVISGEELIEEQQALSQPSVQKLRRRSSEERGKKVEMHEEGLKRTFFRTVLPFPACIRRLDVIPDSKVVVLISPARRQALEIEKKIENIKKCLEPVYDENKFYLMYQAVCNKYFFFFFLQKEKREYVGYIFMILYLITTRVLLVLITSMNAF